MENKKQSIKLIEATPQQIEAPIFKVVNNKDYVLYGENNDYANVLKEAMNNSSIHSAILKRKTDMIASQGFEDNSNVKEFIDNINGKETLNDIVYKSAYDLTLYGGFSFMVTWSKDRKSIARISYVDFSSVRILKDLDDGTEVSNRQNDGVDFYMISNDFKQERKEKYKPKLVQGFSTEYNDEATQLVYVKMYRPGCIYYPIADYQACMKYIILDSELANWHLSSIKNSFSPSLMINMIGGVGSDDEMRLFQKNLEKQYSGSSNASKVILTVSEDQDQLPQIQPLDHNGSDERYRDLADMVKEQIIIGHRSSSTVCGVPVQGKLGNSSEITEAENIYQKQVINAYQTLIERGYTRIMNINNKGELILKKTVTFDLDDIEEDDDKEIKDDKKIEDKKNK